MAWMNILSCLHSFHSILLSKRFLAVLMMIGSFSLACFAQVSVNVQTPASSSTVGTNVTVTASASGTTTITGWYVYVDDQPVWHWGPATLVNPTLNLSVGPHTIRVRAWQADGAYGTAILSVNAQNSTSNPSVSGTSPTSVIVSSPAPGATVGSSVSFNATASSPNGISGWVIYVDDRNVHQVENYSNSLTATVSGLSAGAHTVYVRAWDKMSGYGTSSIFPINVGTSAPTATSGLPVPPENARVFDRIEATTDQWSQCAECAGATNTAGTYWQAPFQTTPSLDGSSRQFYVAGPPWTSALFTKKFGLQNDASHFLWEFNVYVDSKSMSNVWTLEFDLFQSINHREYMIGTHCSFGDGFWYGWNQQTYQWVKTQIPCKISDWAPDTWHRVQMYLERVPGTTNYRYITLVVDNKSYAWNLPNQPSDYQPDWDDVLGVQWQMDTNQNGGDVHMWIDRSKLTIW